MMTSKHLERSKRQRRVSSWRSVADSMRSDTVASAVSVERLDRKPCCDNEKVDCQTYMSKAVAAQLSLQFWRRLGRWRWDGSYASELLPDLLDGMNNGVPPGGRTLKSCETGVENEEKNVTDGFESKVKNPDANTIRASGRGIFHGEEKGTKRAK